MKWVRYPRTSILNYIADQMDGVVHGFKKVLGIGLRVGMLSFHKKMMHWCYEYDSLIAVAKKIMEKENFVEHFINKFKETNKQTLLISKKIRDTDLTKLNKIKLYNLVKRYFNAYYVSWYWGNLSDPLDHHLIIELQNGLKKILGRQSPKLGEYLTVLSTSNYVSLYNLYRKDVLKLVLKIDRELKDKTKVKSLYKKQLRQIANRFYYINFDYSHHKRLTVDDVWLAVQDSLKHLKKSKDELKNIMNHRKITIKKKKKIIKELGIKGDLLYIIETINKLATHHDLRKKYTQIYIYNVQNMYDEIAHRLRVPADYIKWMHSKEILQVIETGKINKKEIQKRTKRCLYMADAKGYRIYTGKEADRMEQKYFQLEKTDLKEVKGMCASKGVVRGRVRVVIKVNEIYKVKKGDILVTGMTTPKFTSILNKVIAIVTDEGGITCHAAIVSRELKIPCVIGTEIVTKVLKDGDLVEVNADQGIIKIIKRR